MYCSKCGKELVEEMKFCPKCGMNINMQMGVDNIEIQSTGQDLERNVILRNLKKAIPIYLGAENLQMQMDKLQMEKKNAEKIDGVKVVCGGGIYVGVALLVFVVALLYVNSNMTGYAGYDMNEDVTEYIMRIIIAITLVVPLVVVLIIDFLYSHHITKKYKRKISTLEVQTKAFINENMCDEVLFLPEKYRYYLAAYYINECVECGRAHNLSEAMNQYEEQLHRWKMENMQQQLLRVRQKTVFVVM